MHILFDKMGLGIRRNGYETACTYLECELTLPGVSR